MTRDPAHDILFESVPIGPVVAPNRFIQVAHCNGMGHRHPRALAAMRGVKAEGGWGIVCTEETEIHPSSDLSPAHEGRIWDDGDLPRLEMVTDAIHAHGSLAAIEMVHNGVHCANLSSRLAPYGPNHMPVRGIHPVSARQMDVGDIRALRAWYRAAAIRAKKVGFDVIYVYAGHEMSILMHFMLKRYNHRGDAYGGSLENRIRLTREILLEVKEAVGDSCAVAFRFSVEELRGDDGMECNGEARDVVGMLAELPDLWDVNVSDWANDSATARFAPEEGYQDRYISFVKSLTSKPVVSVGRYTSVDAMVGRIKKGIVDFVGAARPSIADPFLPRKIDEGRVDEIRECIGCNICVSSDNLSVPIRCTQNPTIGEEWRRGWHPEKIWPAGSRSRVLIVGAGPAGLECGLQLANRGYEIAIAEAAPDMGGRINRESRLPGFSSYRRVTAYRVGLLLQKANVAIHTRSFVDVALLLELVKEEGYAHVIIATGSKWRTDGTGRLLRRPIPGLNSCMVFTPDDILCGGIFPNEVFDNTIPDASSLHGDAVAPQRSAGKVVGKLTGKYVVFDDDHYYMGSAIAEMLIASGCEVVLVTPEALPSMWTQYTLEQTRVHARLLELGVRIETQRSLVRAESGSVTLECLLTARQSSIAADGIVLVTARDPVDKIRLQLHDVLGHSEMGAGGVSHDFAQFGIESLWSIGDCYSPGTVASAVYMGHMAARNLERGWCEEDCYRRE